MQLPLTFFRRGLLGLMDAQDKPRGLLGLFGDEAEEEDASRPSGGADAPSAGGGAPQEVATPWVADEPAQESPLDYARRQAQLFLWEIATLGTGGLTRNPLTGEIYASKFGKRLGDRMSEIAQEVPFGPGRAGGPSRPSGPAAVRTLPQAGPGFLFGGPQATTAENQVYSVPSGDDSEDETTDDCTEQHEEDMEECGERFSYNGDVLRRCASRAGIRLDQCKRGVPRRLRMRRWSDADEDGVRLPRPPRGQKR